MTILAGSGFTADWVESGEVLITFTEAFAAIPTVTTSAQHQGGCPPWATASNTTSTSVNVEVWCETGAANWPFNFIAIGPR